MHVVHGLMTTPITFTIFLCIEVHVCLSPYVSTFLVTSIHIYCWMSFTFQENKMWSQSPHAYVAPYSQQAYSCTLGLSTALLKKMRQRALSHDTTSSGIKTQLIQWVDIVYHGNQEKLINWCCHGTCINANSTLTSTVASTLPFRPNLLKKSKR